ncbi:MAG: hypothetical protein EP330_05485 [Deltaproteobacteria bacterium]|nr:MAG: hypothetical protein EP330_05485 [Deltaproteobacteria bacterium]
MARTLLIAAASLFAVACGAQNADPLQVARTGDQFAFTYTGEEATVVVDAQTTAEGVYTLDFRIDDEHFTLDINDNTTTATVSGDLDMTEARRDAIYDMAVAVADLREGNHIMFDKLYRAASLYGKHPVGEVVATREVRFDATERGWTSLCEHYYNGWTYAGRFDEECNCSWGFCDQCSHTWTSVVGGPNGNNGCYAACGVGCSSGTDYTKDCGNHDACANAGYNDWECLDEWNAASDDYLFAPHC